MKMGLDYMAIVACTVLIVAALNMPNIIEEPALAPAYQRPAAKKYVHEVVEGLSVQSGAYWQQDLLRIGSCRVEKQRKGGFTFGAFNELVIDQLDVCFPPLAPPDVSEKIEPSSGDRVSGDGLSGELELLLSEYPRFSFVSINGMRIGRLDASDKYRSILQAKKARGGRNRTLTLYECEFLAVDEQRICCAEATLELRPPFLISTDKGTYHIADGAEGLGAFLANLVGK